MQIHEAMQAVIKHTRDPHAKIAFSISQLADNAGFLEIRATRRTDGKDAGYSHFVTPKEIKEKDAHLTVNYYLDRLIYQIEKHADSLKKLV